MHIYSHKSNHPYCIILICCTNDCHNYRLNEATYNTEAKKVFFKLLIIYSSKNLQNHIEFN